AHVADCSACLEHVALAAALDVPEATPLSAPTFDLGRLVRRWGWLVPAATAVLVVAVWMRFPEQRRAGAPVTPPAQRAGEARVEPQREAAPTDRDALLGEADES